MEIRRYKIFGLALFDLTLAIAGTVAIFLAAWKYHFPALSPWPFAVAGLLLAIPIGIASHILFGVNTALNRRLGLSY